MNVKEAILFYLLLFAIGFLATTLVLGVIGASQ